MTSACAEGIDLAPAALTWSIHCTALSSMLAAVPVGLMATVRRPTYLFMKWTAPPSPFSGNYRLTYGPLGGMMATTTVSGTSYNITGLMPFTNYRVSVEASNVPVVEFGPALSGMFATLPDATIPPGEEAPTLVVPQVGDGTSGIVEFTIASPPFQRQDFLRCISSSICIHYGVDHTACLN